MHLNKIVCITFLFTLLSRIGFSTHYRAGEITYRQIALTTYEITATTYTDPRNTAADRPEIDINLGDNTVLTVSRANGTGEIVNTDPNNIIKKNIYRTTHTYPGPGKYLISIFDQNRIAGIRNINNGISVDIAFYVESYLNIFAGFGFNQSPILLLPPIDVGCKFRVFTHNPAAYDPDGDSLSFTLIPPKKARGTDVENYTTPLFSDSFSLDQKNGQVTWAMPTVSGPYNIAIKIQEYRKGILIGFVVRDMQIFINDNCINFPPKISAVTDTCIEANQLLKKTFVTTDPDAGQLISLTCFGGPFVQKRQPANINPIPNTGTSPLTTQFSWRPSCNAIRFRPHQAVFRATDNHPVAPLSDIRYYNIQVVAPAPKNFTIKQDSNGFLLNWTPDTCGLAYGYKIYRRIDSSLWQPALCETGVPEYTGFTLLDTTAGLQNTSYFDNDMGRGLSPLIRYCYRITAMYPPRSENGNIIFSEPVESYCSIELCDLILQTKPIITQVTVDSTSNSNGAITIQWLSPLVIDTLDQFPAPYKAQLEMADKNQNNFKEIGIPIVYPSFAALKKEKYTDTLKATAMNAFDYKVAFYYTNLGQFKPLNHSIPASSVFLKLYNTNKSILLSWDETVPWTNTQTVIYKKINGQFDSIATTDKSSFKDVQLENGNTYCYKIKRIGFYNKQLYTEAIENFSQENCGIPIDTVKPCQVSLEIETPCNASITDNQVVLKWKYPSTCEQDQASYSIYWKQKVNDNWILLSNLPNTQFQYTDNRPELSKAIHGCYAVTTTDSSGNESNISSPTCIENCPYYQLPNVFTPSKDDTINHQFKPFPYRFVSQVKTQIYNRWGNLVYETNEPNINWDGSDQQSGIDCPAGVYYYICDVTESYLIGDKQRKIRGSIQLIR